MSENAWGRCLYGLVQVLESFGPFGPRDRLAGELVNMPEMDGFEMLRKSSCPCPGYR